MNTDTGELGKALAASRKRSRTEGDRLLDANECGGISGERADAVAHAIREASVGCKDDVVALHLDHALALLERKYTPLHEGIDVCTPILHVDATPDAGYPLRILRAYRENCEGLISDSTSGETTNPFLAMLNEWQAKRAAVLDDAIALLEGKQK